MPMRWTISHDDRLVTVIADGPVTLLEIEAYFDALVLAGAQVLGAIVDMASGRIPLSGEVRHVPQLISVFLVWFLAVPSTSGPFTRLRGASRAVGLVANGSSSNRAHPGR